MKSKSFDSSILTNSIVSIDWDSIEYSIDLNHCLVHNLYYGNQSRAYVVNYAWLDQPFRFIGAV